MFKPKCLLLVTAAAISLTACSNSEASEPPIVIQTEQTASVQPVENGDEVMPAVTYTEFLKDVNTQRLTFADSSAAKTALYQWINTDMYGYWDETTWDFYGVSRIAGQGEIACGYFVTTLLKDLGFEIDRVRLAQDVSATMIKELTADIHITRTVQGMIDYVNTQPSGSVFIVGLDFHTGFITSGPDGIYFIHSNYIGREGVVKEIAATSAALHDSGYFMIGNLSTRADTMEAWRAN